MTPFTIALTRETGALTGTLTVGEFPLPITAWQQGGDPGHVNARSNTLQITIALTRDADGTRHGGMAIGETEYALSRVVVEGLRISGVAEVVRDRFWERWEAAARGVTLALLLAATPAIAAPPVGSDPNSAAAAWFRSMVDARGISCCSEADCRRTMIRPTDDGGIEAWIGKATSLKDGSVLLLRPARVVYGLAPGSADLIGWQTITITPEMVGQKIAQVLSPEVKFGKNQPSAEQLNWRDRVLEAGGRAGIVRSVDEAVALVGDGV